MSRRTLIILVGALVLAIGAWVLSFRQLDKKWQTKPPPPTKRVAARSAQPLNLQAVTASGKTVAEQLLDKYHGEWAGDISRVYDEMSF